MEECIEETNNKPKHKEKQLNKDKIIKYAKRQKFDMELFCKFSKGIFSIELQQSHGKDKKSQILSLYNRIKRKISAMQSKKYPYLNLFDELTPSKYEDNLKKVINSSEFKGVQRFFEDKMTKLLGDKNKDDLFEECANEECKLDDCPCIDRIELILETYQKMMQLPTLWRYLLLYYLLCTHLHFFDNNIGKFQYHW